MPPAPGRAMLFQARHLPNLISVVRILLVWPLIDALMKDRLSLALALMVLAGLSDALDGFLAKRFDWRTRIGGLLDPIADKLLLVSTFIALTVVGLSPVWLCAVVLARDVTIVAGGVAYQALVEPVQPEPSVVSKLNTGTQLLYLVTVIAAAAVGVDALTVVMLLGAIVFSTSCISGIDYVYRWSRRALVRAPR